MKLYSDLERPGAGQGGKDPPTPDILIPFVLSLAGRSDTTHLKYLFATHWVGLGASLSFQTFFVLALHFLGPFQQPVHPLALTLMIKVLGFCSDLM